MASSGDSVHDIQAVCRLPPFVLVGHNSPQTHFSFDVVSLQQIEKHQSYGIAVVGQCGSLLRLTAF